MPVDLYYSQLSPPSRTVLMVAKHIGIELNLHKLNLFEGEHLKPEFTKINPTHTIPTIVDDGFRLWESRAIAAYFCNQYAPNSDLYPKDPKDRARVDRFLNFDIGTLFPLFRKVAFAPFRGEEVTEEDKAALKKNLELVNGVIGHYGYVAVKHVTIADISFLSAAVGFEFTNYDLTDYPNIKKWYEKLKSELPYFEEINGPVIKDWPELVKKIKERFAK